MVKTVRAIGWAQGSLCEERRPDNRAGPLWRLAAGRLLRAGLQCRGLRAGVRPNLSGS